MSAKRDYYEVLGVSKSDSADTIKSQYRKLALKFHPDRNKSPEAAEHFKEISEAYAVLSDPEKRKVYDQYGHAGLEGRYSTEDIFQGARGNFDDIFSNFGFGGFDSIFESLFGRSGGFGGYSRRRGEDLLYEADLTLEDVFHGKRLDIELKKNVDCNTCKGTGCAPGTKKETCSACRGQGQIRITRNMGFSTFMTVQPCSKCRGQGQIITKPCSECRGTGKVKGTKHLSFEVPAGIDNGDYVISGEGESVQDGSSGDLIVRVRVKPHPFFKRDGADIFYDAKITIADACLGANIEVPTLEKPEKIKVEEGTQPNAIIKLKGKGLPHVGSRGRGDQYVRLVVEIPTKLDKHQKELLQKLRDSFK
ncbi:molecular chaperone DnaJ [Candidatus Nitrosotenuis uzonensis]|uniref:Chaperone protein dnaJ, heat shock protein (Hsp40), co-chaperone with dnaK n=1 Tax=Candidatus Nitrosotenuis uzonensis TaxID=1407055 RepID=V6AVH9_9ARCH|nr:molecular chaperone DnaJ [Candidatus Nitrosotenuis uzonensis]CDI06518.1 Chaperone protein dnaJ, heat shock protein (Hsp40), co-chaperone with dnaK [Candidatus Nitrosotenuis uzonensis]